MRVNMDTASTTSGPQFVGEIGVKGELYIAVDKTEYYAGDTVTGRLTVNVSETIQCDSKRPHMRSRSLCT